MDIFKKIISWNTKQCLLDCSFDHKKEASFIIEELLESSGKYDSVSAREKAMQYAEEIVGDSESEAEIIVDSLADIIVFATGAIAKKGYDPTKVMNEVLKEINEREGEVVKGKFVKVTEAETHKADFSKCLLEK